MTGVKPRGFSAIEMLVVTALFAIASLTVAATYVNFTRLHRRAANAEILGEEMRFITELMVRSARNNTPVYPSLPSQLPLPTSSLSLVSLSSTSTVSFRHYATTSAPCAGLNASCLAISVNNGTWTPITGKNIAVNSFRVYVNPTRTPFQETGVGTYNNNNQPRVTLSIDASYVATSTIERATLSVQTSVDSRIYVR
jgi:prepilin-type N-terminal cleavage/methylation domain-containing protein